MSRESLLEVLVQVGQVRYVVGRYAPPAAHFHIAARQDPVQVGQLNADPIQPAIQRFAVSAFGDAPKSASIAEDEFRLAAFIEFLGGSGFEQTGEEPFLVSCQLRCCLDSDRLTPLLDALHHLTAGTGQGVELLAHLDEPAPPSEPLLPHDAAEDFVRVRVEFRISL